MRTSVLPARLAALAVGVVLAGSLLAGPATADDASTVSAAALPRTGELAAYGPADWQRLAQQACNAPGTAPEVLSTTYDQTENSVEALLITAKVDRNSDQAFDAVCSFAVIATRADTGQPIRNVLNGSWQLIAGPAGELPSSNVTGSMLTQSTVTTTPIFTHVQHRADAYLRTEGDHLSTAPSTEVVPPQAKTPTQLASARSQHQRETKLYKKRYSRDLKKASALKTAKKRKAAKAQAKRTYRSEIARSKRIYQRNISPRPATTRVVHTTVRTPFILTLSNAR